MSRSQNYIGNCLYKIKFYVGLCCNIKTNKRQCVAYYTSCITTIGPTLISFFKVAGGYNKKKCMTVCCFDNIAVAILDMPVEYKIYFKIQPFFINKYYISNIT